MNGKERVESGEWRVESGGRCGVCVRRQDLLKGPLLPARGQEGKREREFRYKSSLAVKYF